MKSIRGKVVSDKMTQTVVVEVTRLVSHPLYHKRMRKTKKFHAHNEIGAKLGDTVEMHSNRPISATKHWVVSKIVK